MSCFRKHEAKLKPPVSAADLHPARRRQSVDQLRKCPRRRSVLYRRRLALAPAERWRVGDCPAVRVDRVELALHIATPPMDSADLVSHGPLGRGLQGVRPSARALTTSQM